MFLIGLFLFYFEINIFEGTIIVLQMSVPNGKKITFSLLILKRLLQIFLESSTFEKKIMLHVQRVSRPLKTLSLFPIVFFLRYYSPLLLLLVTL